MKKNRKNIKEFVHISGIIDKLLKAHRYESNEDLMQVWNLWDSVVGEDIAKNARPAAFKERLLLVHTTSSSWIHQLQFLKKDIITKVNVAFGRELIKEIKFKIGPI